MTQWKKVKIDFPTIKLGNFIEPIKSTVYDLKVENPIVYGVTNKEGIVQTGKPSSKDISNYIMLENDCFAFNPYRVNVGSIGINDRNITGCVSPAYVVFKTKNGLLPKFLYFYLKSDYGIHLINWYGNRGGVRNALRYSDLCDIDIPDIREIDQHAFLNKFTYVSNTVNELTGELKKQKSHIKQLRQNILQDAIEGKLTADWRKDHPVIKGDPNYDAEALFEKIQKEKTDKKQKSYPAITDEDKPFEIPESWKWVRLNDICSNIVDCPHTTPLKSNEKTQYPCIRTSEIQNGEINWESMQYIDYTEYKKRTTRLIPKKNDIVYAREGAFGDAVLLPEGYNFSLGQRTMLLRVLVNPKYVLNSFLSPFLYAQALKQNRGATVGHVNVADVKSFTISLPPLKEQEEIVNKVEHLLAQVTDLENQIAERETYTKQLMQSILKDAFGEKE